MPNSHWHASCIGSNNRAYYRQQAMNAWSIPDGVPYQITNTPRFAYYHACIIAHWWQELNTQHPLTMIDLGAGTGQFSFYLSIFLQERLPFLPGQRNVRLVMLDCSPGLIAAWQRHPQLAPMIERGQIVCALDNTPDQHWLDALCDYQNDACVWIANYFFSCLHHQSWQRIDQTWQRMVPTSQSISTNTSPLAFQPISPHQPLDSALAELLNDYSQSLSTPYCLIPTEPLEKIHAIAQYSSAPGLLIAHDKGYRSITEIAYNNEFDWIQEGGYATMVNFDALYKLCQPDCTPRMATTQHPAIQPFVAAIHHSLADIPKTCAQIDALLLTPKKQGYNLCHTLSHHHLCAESLLEIQRQYHFDPLLLAAFAPTLMSLYPALSDSTRRACQTVIALCIQRYFTMPHTGNDAILLARLARRFHQPEIAQQCLDHHPDLDTFYFHFEKTLLFLAKEQINRAKQSYAHARKSNPTHPWIQASNQGEPDWIEHLKSRLDRYL